MKISSFIAKSSVLIAIFFTLAIQLNAQQNYKLADYVNPNYFYHSLDFTMNLNSYGHFAHNETANSSSLSKTNASSLSGNFNIAYYQIKNTTKYQGTQNIWINFDGGWNKDHSINTITSLGHSSATNRQKSFNSELDYSSSNRFYNSRKQFLEIVPKFVLKFHGDRNTHEENPIIYPFNPKNLSNSHNISLELSVMLGMGRIENIENARLALYILNDLQKSGDIKKDLSNEQVNQLANFLTTLRNKRFFDSRIRNIASITSVDSLLTAMGIREHSGASYFMILNDDWNYANGPIRQTGHRFAFGVTPGYSNSFLKSIQDSILNSSDPTISRIISTGKTRLNTVDFGVYYYLERPINLTWQHSTRVGLGYELIKQVNSISANSAESSDNKGILYNPNLHFSFKKSYGYYPNSRTNLALDCVLQGLYYIARDNNELKNHQLSLYASAFLRGNYYFSPQLRLNLSAGVSENYQHNDNFIGTSSHVLSHYNGLHPTISLSLRYSIF